MIIYLITGHEIEEFWIEGVALTKEIAFERLTMLPHPEDFQVEEWDTDALPVTVIERGVVKRTCEG